MVAPKGGLIFGVLVFGATASTPATKANLDNWITSIASPNTWALDSKPPQDPLTDFFGTGHDEFVIVDLQTMKIVELVPGNVRLALTKLNALLDAKL